MSYQHIVPVHQVEGSIGSKFHVHGAEVSILAAQQVLSMSTGVAGWPIFQGVLLGAQETDRVVNEPVSLHGIGEMTTGDKLQT